MKRVFVDIKAKITISVLWTLWILLSVNNCYVEKVYQSDRVIRREGFISVVYIALIIIALLLMYLNKYAFVNVGIATCLISILIPIMGMVSSYFLSKIDIDIYYIQAGPSFSFPLMIITIRGCVCILVTICLLVIYTRVRKKFKKEYVFDVL